MWLLCFTSFPRINYSRCLTCDQSPWCLTVYWPRRIYSKSTKYSHFSVKSSIFVHLVIITPEMRQWSNADWFTVNSYRISFHSKDSKGSVKGQLFIRFREISNPQRKCSANRTRSRIRVSSLVHWWRHWFNIKTVTMWKV